MSDLVAGAGMPKSDWSQARTAVGWIGAGVMLVGGLITAASWAGWPNDVVTGVIEMMVSPIFIPSLLRRLRERLPAFRPVWMPVLLWIATGPVATVAGLPFLPSPARQGQLKVEAITDANRLLAAGQPFQARMRLNKFAPLRIKDPAIAAIFAKIAAAERTSKPVGNPMASVKPTQIARTAAPSNKASPVRDNSDVDAEAYLTTIKALQRKMNDPTSLLVLGNTIEHTVDASGKPILKSYVKYRGTNAYGGTVTEAAIIMLSPDGKTVLAMEDATAAL